jgi:hypothetical protein
MLTFWSRRAFSNESLNRYSSIIQNAVALHVPRLIVVSSGIQFEVIQVLDSLEISRSPWAVRPRSGRLGLEEIGVSGTNVLQIGLDAGVVNYDRGPD